MNTDGVPFSPVLEQLMVAYTIFKTRARLAEASSTSPESDLRRKTAVWVDPNTAINAAIYLGPGQPTYSECVGMGDKKRAAGDSMRCGPDRLSYVKSGRRTRTMADGTTIDNANIAKSIIVSAHSASPLKSVCSKLHRQTI
jgi:hypothetical protein